MDNLDADYDGPDIALLSRPSSSRRHPEPLRLDDDYKMTRLGNTRAYWLGAVLCIGGFLFGYDSGIIGRRPLNTGQLKSAWSHFSVTTSSLLPCRIVVRFADVV